MIAFHRGNSGRIEWRWVACVTLAYSQSRATGSGRGSWEHTSHSLFVCIKPLLESPFKRAASAALWLRAWRDTSGRPATPSLLLEGLHCTEHGNEEGNLYDDATSTEQQTITCTQAQNKEHTHKHTKKKLK